METLLSFVKALDPSEIKGFRSWMKKLDPSSKSLKLFELLLKDVNDKDSVSYRIYGTSAGPKLDMLGKRLMAKLEEYLISDNNIEGRGETLEPKVVYEVTAKKKMAFIIYIHRTKGASQLLYEALDELIEYSKKYEIFKVLTEAYRTKMQLMGLRHGEKAFKEMEKHLQHYTRCDHAVTVASNYYHELAIIRRFDRNIDAAELQKRISEWINELRGLYKETGAIIVNYYLKMLEADYYESMEEFYLAKRAIYEKKQLILQHKALYVKSRVIICDGQMVAFDIQLGNYEDVVRACRECIEQDNKLSFNHHVSQKLLFNGLFYLEKYEDARRIALDLLNKFPVIDSGSKNGIHVTYYCFACFAQRDYEEVLNMLNRKLEVSKDKTGWDISTRVLLIMTFVEMDRLDEASMHVERLRKHVERYGKTEFITERDRTIVKLLQALDSNGFIFDPAHAKISALVQKLGQDKSCKWKRLTPELIPFHEWVKGKMK